MDAEELDELARAAELHDIGKVGIPDAILDKPGQLDADEWEFMRQHTILGERILSAAPALRPVAAHRARQPRAVGRRRLPGRPRQAKIPLAARIVAACDAYRGDHRRPLLPEGPRAEAARRELLREAGHQFDPAVVAAFLDELEQPQDALVAADEDETAGQFAEEVAARFRQMLEHRH